MISISDITIMPVNTNTVVMKLNKKTSLTKISEKMSCIKISLLFFCNMLRDRFKFCVNVKN